jgi:hypothetical protein
MPVAGLALRTCRTPDADRASGWGGALAVCGLAPPPRCLRWSRTLSDLPAFALTVFVIWMPLLLVVPCLAVWVLLLRGELRAEDDSIRVEAGLTIPTLPPGPDTQMHGRS